jgi:hypothetical protein
MRMLLVFRIHDLSNPNMSMDSPLLGFFPKALIFITRPLKMDDLHPFRDFAKSNAKMSRHLVLLIPKILSCEMLTAPDLHHVSQLMDDSDLFQGFYPGYSQSLVLRTSDISISEIPMTNSY